MKLENEVHFKIFTFCAIQNTIKVCKVCDVAINKINTTIIHL